MSSPRDHALLQLDAKRLPGWHAGALPKSTIRNPQSAIPTDPRDLALAENITVGVIKNLLLLQHVTRHHSGRNLKSIDPAVQKILAVALYQLRFLDRVPASAAVDQAVEQTRRFGHPRAAGFVNAVLRKATRDPSPPLPDRDAPTDYARIVCSHPDDLVKRLEKLLGPADALRFCEHDQAEPPTILRLAPGIDPTTLAIDGITLTPHEEPGMFVVTGAKGRSHLADWANRNLAQAQDPTAARVAPLTHASPGQTILDRCCGLGTKTLQLQSLVTDTGAILAMDPAEPRCETLRQTLARRQIASVAVHCAAWLKDIPNLPPFDAILADVPCSNSGVLARRPEARYHQTPAALASLAKLQDRILDDTAPFLKPGGLLVYSTCSVWPEENDDRVHAFLKRHPDYDLESSDDRLPSFGSDPTRYHDGGYVAVLRRK